LIVWGNRGMLALVETAAASPGKYQELARRANVFSSDVWPHVVLSGRRLYLKDRDGNLKCFVLKD
ncbi:MAG: polyvinylalcohol dehydrogenase, partial [Pirellulales bacterium]